MLFLDKIYRLKKKTAAGKIISIDLHTDYLKMVRASRARDKLLIQQFGYRRLFSQDKTYSHLADKLRELLRELGVDEKEAKKSGIYLILSGSEVCVRVIKLPLMPKEEIAQAVKAKIKEVVSYSLEEMVFDFSILGETQERGTKKFDIVFIAIRKNDFFNYLDIFNSLGLQPRLATSTCFCEWNLLKALGEGDSSLSIIAISTGHSDTDISVFKEGRLIFTRNIPFGEKDFIEALKNGLNISWEEAEGIKNDCGLSAGGASEKYQFPSSQIQAIMEKQADILFKEIDLTSHHYYQITHGEGVDKYTLSGSAISIKGLRDFLFHRLDMPVEEMGLPQDTIQPEEDCKEAFAKDSSFYLHNLGVMLVYPESVNLMSSGKTKVTHKPPLLKSGRLPEISLAKYIIIFASFLIIMIFALLKIQNIYYNSQIRLNRAKYEQLQERQLKALQLNRQIEYLEFKKNFYAGLQKKNIFYPQIILEIYKAIPQGEIILEQIEIAQQANAENSIAMRGVVQGKDYLATSFMLALEKSGYFEGLSLNTFPIFTAEAQGLSFTINGRLTNKR